MYRLYRDWLQKKSEFESADENRKAALLSSEARYRSIFSNYRNIGFHRTEDGCDLCQYHDRRGKRWHPIYVRHRIFEKRMRELHQQDSKIKDPEILALTADLGSVKLMLKVNEGFAFYLSRLSVYPFPIHDMSDKTTQFMVWSQVEGGRGTNSIISALWHYLNTIVPSLPKFAQDQAKHLRIWFDNCSGQNKLQFNADVFVLFCFQHRAPHSNSCPFCCKNS